MRRLLLAALALAAGGCDTAGPAGPITGDWVLASGDAAVGATLTFSPDGALRARLVCNSVTGRYTADGDRLSIEVTGSTFALCDGPPETPFLDALEAATRYGVADGVLTLTGPGVRLRFGAAPR